MSKIKKKRSYKVIHVTIRQHRMTSAKSQDAYSVQKSVFKQSSSKSSSQAQVEKHFEIQSAYSSSSLNPIYDKTDKNQVIVLISN